MKATLSKLLSFFIKSSPISLLEISFLFLSLISCSMSSTVFSIACLDIGRFSHDFRIPLRTLFRSNCSLRPSFLITVGLFHSIRSYVVNLLPHLPHSLRLLLIFIESFNRLSITDVPRLSQNGHFTSHSTPKHNVLYV